MAIELTVIKAKAIAIDIRLNIIDIMNTSQDLLNTSKNND